MPATTEEPADGPPVIATPDRRLRVFISSTLEELAPERAAVRAAVTGLRLTPVMFEAGARAHPPRDLYRAYLDQSDVFVGVYGDRYGWVAPGMGTSGLEDEFELSAGLPRLLYVRTPAPDREPELDRLVRRVQAESGSSTTPFRTPAELAERVADDLAVLLTERFTRPRAAPPGLAGGWLPTPPAPLVGRRAELATLTGLLADESVRLVTLTGPGGTGKTRLALAAAAELVAERDGVWFVDLAPVGDPADVPAAVAAAVGVPAEGTRPLLDLVADRLAGLRALLVLDNLEQVAGVAPELGRLLSRCPHTQLLTTSRTVLRLRGEHDVPLGPLGTPPDGDSSPATVGAADAVRLFVDRARAADPSFELTAANAGAVAELVRRLDGLPLAVELAAARVRTLPPQALLRRLGDALAGSRHPVLDLRGGEVDAPDRQRTLRATIGWSHDLLAPAERTLLARLAVCAAGFTLDTAEAVGAVDDDLDVLDGLSALVGQSLVAPGGGDEGGPRFRMLELVRAFALERLREAGEEAATRERLARHLAATSAAAGAGLSGVDRLLWQGRLDAESADLVGSLRWAVETDAAELAVRLAAPLARWWWARGQLSTMAEIADRTADLPSARALPPDAAALLLWARGLTRIAQGRVAEGAPLLTALVDDARGRDDHWLLGHGLTGLAMTRPAADPELAGLLEEGVAALRRSGDAWSVAYALVPRGDVALVGGDLATATRLHTEALGLAGQIGDEHLTATVLDQLAFDDLLAGELDAAHARLTTAAGLHRRLHDQEGTAYCLDGLSALALASGRPVVAARAAGAAAAARAALGLVVWPLLQSLGDQLDAALRDALGEEADVRERAAGAAAGPWVTLDAVLADLAHPVAPPP
ncbi:ATP-binding protein [Modestobacter versicolor]|uniref:ATP-binding protein n=1 Tax=Modestobacter versicolor TaxID=429133 RepID=UPI0034E00067